MERDSSDDEENDRSTLVPQNGRHVPVFQIESSSSSSSLLRFNNKRYFFAIFFPLLILLLYFTTDFRKIFQTNVPVITDLGSSRIRESVYLLKRQESELFQMLNYASFVNSTNSMLVEDLKSQVLAQIALNKRIQGVILSDNDNYSNTGWRNSCGEVDQRLSDRKTVEWKPRPDKYLIAICVSGQMSNHLICLEKHMFFAALLNRVLVIPSSKVDFDFHRVLDIEHINECVGRKVVVKFEEFAESRKNHLHVDQFMCYFSLPQPCFMDDERLKKLKGIGISLGKIQAVWKEDVKKPSRKTEKDVLAKFASDDDVIVIGDVFFADVERDWVMQSGGPIAHRCKTLIEPSRLILLTAQRFIQTFLGKDFVALHFRRHGFLKFCNAKQPSCFYPVPQAAECINRVVERANTPLIYLSTDAAESETGLLQSLIVLNGKSVPLVQRPARNSAEKWDALLYRHGLDGDSQVEAMLDKTICALSSVFIGASGSTFTEDILRLRKGWTSASICDQYLCQGELPNYIAEDE